MSGMQALDLSLYACEIFEQLDEKSGCAICAQSLCGIALQFAVAADCSVGVYIVNHIYQNVNTLRQFFPEIHEYAQKSDVILVHFFRNMKKCAEKEKFSGKACFF